MDRDPPAPPFSTPPPATAIAPDAEPMVRIRLTVAYNGRAYFGWQWQNGQISVQQVLEQALARIFPAQPRVSSSSRTDTGVHAQGMVVHFDLPKSQWRMTPRKLPLALNAHLPDDVRVFHAAKTSFAFHARFSASAKQYRYLVWSHTAAHPLWREFTWHLPRSLDLDAMRTAARSLIGRRDFLAFSATPGYPRKHTIRNLRRCDIKRSGPLLTFIIEADGFLYKMCRGIVGTLVQIGAGKFHPHQLLPMIESRDRTLAGMTAPAHGLTLWKVYYQKGKTYDPRSASPQAGPLSLPADPPSDLDE